MSDIELLNEDLNEMDETQGQEVPPTEEPTEEVEVVETFHMHPFTYGFEPYAVVEQGKEKDLYNSFFKQREAGFKDVKVGEYNNEGLEEGELNWRAFHGTIQVPTSPLMEIDGYKTASEVAPEEGEGDAEEQLPKE